MFYEIHLKHHHEYNWSYRKKPSLEVVKAFELVSVNYS